jgi:hypothetical protein
MFLLHPENSLNSLPIFSPLNLPSTCTFPYHLPSHERNSWWLVYLHSLWFPPHLASSGTSLTTPFLVPSPSPSFGCFPYNFECAQLLNNIFPLLATLSPYPHSLPLKVFNPQALLAHACNPSYSGSWDQEDWGWKPAPGKQFMSPYLKKKKKKPITRRDRWSGSSSKIICLARMRPWVQTPVLNNNNKRLEVWLKPALQVKPWVQTPVPPK